MSCYFCGGSRIASLHSAPDRGIRNWSVGSMTLARRYDGQPIIALELDTAVALDISVNGGVGDSVSADPAVDRLHRGHQVLPVLRRGALGERGAEDVHL